MFPPVDWQKLLGENLKVWEEKGPFPGNSVEGLEWLGEGQAWLLLRAHHQSISDGSDKWTSLCESWETHSDVVMSYSQRLEWTEKGQLEIRWQYYGKRWFFPVVVYGCGSWTIKKAEHRRIDALELWCWRRLLRVPWTARRSNQSIQPGNSGNQPWVFIGRTDKTPLLWPPDAKSQLIGKDPDAGKDGGQEEKGMTEDEMVGWHHWLSGHEFEQTLGDSEGQGSLVCCSSWGCKESDMTGWLNNDNNWFKTTYSGILFKAKTYYYTPFSSSVAFITSSYYNYSSGLIS